MQETLGNDRPSRASSSPTRPQTSRAQLIEEGIAQTLLEIDADAGHADTPGRRPIDFEDDFEPAQVAGEGHGWRGRRSPIREDAARPIVAALATVAVVCLALLGVAIAQGYIP